MDAATSVISEPCTERWPKSSRKASAISAAWSTSRPIARSRRSIRTTADGEPSVRDQRTLHGAVAEVVAQGLGDLGRVVDEQADRPVETIDTNDGRRRAIGQLGELLAFEDGMHGAECTAPTVVL